MPRKKSAMFVYTDPRPLVERSVSHDRTRNRALRTVTINLAESPLAWLHSRGHLTDRQLLAGEKLRGDYEAAMLGARVTMNWDNVPPGRSRRSAPAITHESERVTCAKGRFDSAIAALGNDLADIAWRVICAGEGIPLAERQLHWPARSGKLVLRIALDRLADFYRLPG
jgi:hypothetical protein